MAYDKVIDSTFLNNGLTAIADKIREKGGATDTLAFPDGFVSAIDAIEGGGEEEIVTVMKKYLVNTSDVLKSSGNTTNTYNGTYYETVSGYPNALSGSGECSITIPADITNAKNKYSLDKTASSELWYVTNATYVGYSITYDVYDLTKLEAAEKTYVEVYTGGDIASGTYVFASDGYIYYYEQEKQEKYATVTITSTCNGINGDTSHIIITSPEAFAPDSSNPSNRVTTWTVYCYDMPNCTITLLKGSTIKCFVRDTKANNRGYICINGENVLEGNGNYTHTVTKDIAIDVSDAYDQGEYGKITITE